jgi:riboflavin synthase
MFTGIIESTAQIVSIAQEEGNLTIGLNASFVHELKIDQSVAHNGICLTVTAIKEATYYVTAIQETIRKTSIGDWQKNDFINLERCMVLGGRLDGHIVQGHVDQTGVCTAVEDQNGSWLYTIEYDASAGNITIEKGSITLNGISLTVVNSGKNSFQVAIIPYTYEYTNMKFLKPGQRVNLEFDILGKYISKLIANRIV